MLTVAVVDYGMGNLHSVCKALEKTGTIPKVTACPKDLEQADAVVLPGVGSFDPTIQNLRSRGLIEPIQEAIISGKPFLGICMGMQALFESSEEGQETGLGIIAGQVRQFHPEPGLKIPHMGWNQLQIKQSQLPLWHQLPAKPFVYFVHSYYVEPKCPDVSAATVTHGTQTVTAVIIRHNLIACQFHPEKSSTVGLRILSNFINLTQLKVY